MKKKTYLRHFNIQSLLKVLSLAGAAEAGVPGVPRNTQYLAAFFHKLSGKKKIFKIGQNLTKLEGKSVVKSDVTLS